MKKLLIPVSAVISTMLLFSGCAHTDRREDRAATAGNATLGQQLEDLQQAYKSKAISKKEYKQEKKKLLKDY